MIAALPMYDRAETAQANDRFWHLIRENLGRGPKTLSRDMDVWDIWQSPDLLLAQTCGYPYRARLHGHVILIGTPDHGVKDCPAGYYNSVFITRRNDERRDLSALATATFAYNEPLSQSGWAAPMTHMTARGLRFAKVIPSGAHLNSAHMVADGRADIAAIDAVTWAMIKTHEPFAADLHVVDRTEPTPGLPYIAALDADQAALFAALEAAIHALSDTDKRLLNLKSIVKIPAQDYIAIPTPAAPDSLRP